MQLQEDLNLDEMDLGNKEWRMRNLYYIADRSHNLKLFSPNNAQAHFMKHKAKRNLILKSRRLGFSTFACIDSLDDVLFTENFNATIIAHDKDSAVELFDDKVSLAWRHFVPKSLYSLDTDRSNKLKFGFGDKTFSAITVKSSARSGTVNKLHVSEFGKICAKYPKKAKEIITGSFPAVPLHGSITIESTAEGDTGEFHDMFWDAYTRPANQPLRPTEFKAFFYNWQWDAEEINKILSPDAQLPKEFLEYQMKHNAKAIKFPNLFTPITDIQITYYFYKWLEVGKDWKKLRQEYPTTPEEAFVSSGDKLFDPDVITKYTLMATEPIQKINEFLIYEQPIAGHHYALGVDVSEGIGQDHSAITVMDFTTRIPKVVATYKSNRTEPDMLAHEIKFIGTMYYFALAAVERNNHGHATLNELKKIYRDDSIYRHTRKDEFDDKETEKLGWDTNMSTKPRMMYDLKTATNQNAIDIPSKPLLHEMKTYSRDGLRTNKKDPEASNHFDLLIAAAICYQMRTELDQDQDNLHQTYNPHKESRNNIHSAI